MSGRGHESLAHDAFVYGSDDEFLAGAVPFVRDAVAAGEPVLVAPTSANLALLRGELGPEAEGVDWADEPESHTPLQRLGIFKRFIGRHVGRGTGRVRLLGEPAWPENSPAGVAEWKRYESFLNVALAPHPVWLVCPYDVRVLADDIVGDARHTHPTMRHCNGREASPGYVEPLDFARRLDEAVPFHPPPSGALEQAFGEAGAVRSFVVEQAHAAGVEHPREEDVRLAVSEIATNVFRHAGSLARVKTWRAPRAFVCEVGDDGPGVEDPFAGYVVPDPTQEGGWGLAIARQVCDVLELRAGPVGTTVRLHFRLA